MKAKLDDIDYKILDILLHDGSVSYAEIGKQVFVSAGTVHVRIKKMQNMGVIAGSKLEVDYTKLGYDIFAFLGIYLDKNELYEVVIEKLEAIPEILSAYYTTGNYSIFVSIVCKDTKHLMELLHNKIQKIEGIQRTETIISLEESLRRPLKLVPNKED